MVEVSTFGREIIIELDDAMTSHSMSVRFPDAEFVRTKVKWGIKCSFPRRQANFGMAFDAGGGVRFSRPKSFSFESFKMGVRVVLFFEPGFERPCET